MFRISAITRVGLVAVACVAVAAPSALAKPPVKSLYGYAMSYTPSKATKTAQPKAAKVQSVHYGYAMSYKPTKATTKEAAKVQSVRYGYAMSYSPTKATRKQAAKGEREEGERAATTPSAPVSPMTTDTEARAARLRSPWAGTTKSTSTTATMQRRGPGRYGTRSVEELSGPSAHLGA